MKFSQITYERVDLQALKADVLALTEQLRGAAGFEEAERAYLQMNELESRALHGMRTGWKIIPNTIRSKGISEIRAKTASRRQ